jgi:hypothetical protein
MLAIHLGDSPHERARRTCELAGLPKDPSVFAVSGGVPEVGSVIQIQNFPIERWRICSALLKLRNKTTDSSFVFFICPRFFPGGGHPKGYPFLSNCARSQVMDVFPSVVRLKPV